MKNVFISFDMDDTHMIDLLRMQAKNSRFLFEFRDYSVKENYSSMGGKRESLL